MNRDLKQERIPRAFVSPTNFRTGANFSTKSEERRFLKQFDAILKLRHVLLNDRDKAKTYTKQVLASYFSPEEMQQFSELGILNFQNTVRQTPPGPSDMEVRDFILKAVSAANRIPVSSLGDQQQRSNLANISGPQEPQSSLSNFICNFEVDNGNVTSLGLNSGKHQLQQQSQDRSKRSSV